MGVVVAAQQLAPEFGQREAQIARAGEGLPEEFPDTAAGGIERTDRQHIIPQVAAVERAVHESRESAQLLPGGMADEIGRCIVHELHHAAGVAHDGASVAPGDRRSEETGDLPVVGVGETMRHADGVGFDEFGPVIAVVPPLEQFAQLAA